MFPTRESRETAVSFFGDEKGYNLSQRSVGKFGGNGERRKKRRRGRKVMSSNKGELSQLITFPAKPEEGRKEASNGAKHLGQFREGREGSNLASLHGSQGSLCKIAETTLMRGFVKFAAGLAMHIVVLPGT